ncbi:calcineurin-like phosphoesterase family protein [Nitratireductor luteus]|uniref:calcineurin-like phosphoesterase family protein n=1 Tax=Nitratireductor luteus TaxID=2976980 RepID=UPI0022408995|nr:calcineurin-like phosphoesterase family protein [Nitratireductor luteus]
MKRLSIFLFLAASTALAAPAAAKDTSYIGSVHTVSGTAANMARGKVFLDANRNARLDEGEGGVEGVLVSNGREVVKTDATGAYELPAYDDMNLFITKPAGYAVPVSEEMVPQFHYIHKAAGSPDLRFGGIEPTGLLPEAINFPLVEDDIGDQFSCLVFGDPQPYNNREVGYVRETVGTMLANRDNTNTECLIFEGDVIGDDLSLYPRFKKIVATGRVPQYFVPGNHDVDFDAESDTDSYDTFRREWGPEYYSFDIGNVHFVVLDNVRYPCNGVDDHPFCDPAESPTYNGVIHDRQLEWLRNDLAHVPQDKLIVLNAHIPFVTFTDNTAQKHQTDNLDVLYEIIGDRPALGLSGHTHTTEQIMPGENFEGWAEATNTGPAKFHQIVTGAVSGSWWSGDLDDRGVPRSTQRLGNPRGYFVFEFDGSDYVETFVRFGGSKDEQMHVSFNTPRFREWAADLLAFADLYETPNGILPPVTVNDLGDINMITLDDLKDGTWVAANVWSSAKGDTVSISIDGGAAIQAQRTQPGNGEAKLKGPEYADPLALVTQATVGRAAFRSARGGDSTAGFTTGRGSRAAGLPGPLSRGLLTDSSSHLWRADLPETLAEGVHVLEVKTTDRYGRTFTQKLTFEVVNELPDPDWNEGLFN